MTAFLTLDELLLFNDEVAGLVRPGVPLPEGLSRFAADSRGRLKDLGGRLAEGLKNGETLSEGLQGEGVRVPRAYQQMIRIAEETGSLSTALESLSGAARSLQELQRALGRALWYPLLVGIFGYGMILVFLTQGWSRFRDLMDKPESMKGFHFEIVEGLARTVGYWGWIPPAAVVIFILGNSMKETGDLLSLAGGTWIPGTGRLQREWRAIQFTRFLASLVRLGMPLSTAIDRSAELTGDRRIESEAAQLTEVIRKGDTGVAVFRSKRGKIPGLVKWAVLREPTDGKLGERLDLIAEGMQERAMRSAERLRFVFPIVSTVLVGGGTVLLYGWLMFSCLGDLWEGLAAP